jgi:hypothetical protein
MRNSDIRRKKRVSRRRSEQIRRCSNALKRQKEGEEVLEQLREESAQEVAWVKVTQARMGKLAAKGKVGVGAKKGGLVPVVEMARTTPRVSTEAAIMEAGVSDNGK